MTNPTNSELSERAKNGFLYYIIPTQIYEDENLSESEILFYALISNLSVRTGFCYASDAWLANKRKVDERTVKRWLENLEKNRYIKRVTTKNGMYWDRKIYICVSFKSQDSKNVCEETLAPVSKGQPKGHLCPDRGDENVPRVLEVPGNFSSSKSTTTTTSGGLGGLPPKEGKRLWLLDKIRGKFGEAFDETVFNRAFEEFSTILPSTYTSPEGFFAKIYEKWLFHDPQQHKAVISTEQRDDRILRHLKQAQKNSGPGIVPSELCVFFGLPGSGSRCPISYDCSDEEWKRQTGWE